MKTIKVHISTIKHGDTINHNGELRTVCNSDINNDGFMGITIFGDSYRLGYKEVEKVLEI